ncbi:ABC transporter substrate-binding protein [Natronorubrum halophilum]|uniref:ABC transporter substrate-binding protein n=1 Tax=Natronorubrum halophilum TaxID=1702106 RepID=UPI0010C17B80|nr:ABC transporter substrate-binding protein [Natronorubrum halophilum]
MTRTPKTRMNRRNYIKAAGAGVSTSILAGCFISDEESGDTITIVALEPLSGVFSVYGSRHRDGAEFAAEQINADGGVRDQDIEIDVVDTEGTAQETVTAFTEAIDRNNAVAGIGPGASEAAIRGGDVALQNEVPLYLHAAGAVAANPRDNDFVFRTSLPATPTVGRAQAQIIEEGGYNNIGVIFEDGVWGDEYGAAIDEYFPDDITLTTETAPIPETDFVPLLRGFPDDTEVILGSGHPAGVSSMYNQVYEVGLDPDLYLGAITPMEADYDALGDGIEESFASFNATDMYSDDYADVASTYLEETGDVFDHAQVNGYVSVRLIADSIAEAGSADPVDIAEATRTGSFDLLFGSPIEYTEWGEVENSVQIYNSFTIGESPDHWPDVGFAPEETFRTDPLPAYEPGELDI